MPDITDRVTVTIILFDLHVYDFHENYCVSASTVGVDQEQTYCVSGICTYIKLMMKTKENYACKHDVTVTKIVKKTTT